jgi:hypothetical protein
MLMVIFRRVMLACVFYISMHLVFYIAEQVYANYCAKSFWSSFLTHGSATCIVLRRFSDYGSSAVYSGMMWITTTALASCGDFVFTNRHNVRASPCDKA